MVQGASAAARFPESLMLFFLLACAPISSKSPIATGSDAQIDDTADGVTIDDKTGDSGTDRIVPEDTDPSDESLPPCPPVAYAVEDMEGEIWLVPALLLMERGADSPSGMISSGMGDLFHLEATGYCLDMVLAQISFSLRQSDGASAAWVARAGEVDAELAYTYAGTDARDPMENVVIDDTVATWTHVFSPPLRINRDETIAFSFRAAMGDEDGFRPGVESFMAAMEPEVEWYGANSPDSYPDSVNMGRINGNSLTLGE